MANDKWRVMVSHFYGDTPAVCANALTKDEAEKLATERRASNDGYAYSVEKDNP